MPRPYRYGDEISRELFVELDLEPSEGLEQALVLEQGRGQVQAQDREQVGEWEKALSPVWARDQVRDWECGVRGLRECKP